MDDSDTYAAALHTTRAVVEALLDEPDPDGFISKLIQRIEGERAWLRAELALGTPPARPPEWVRRETGRARAQR